MNPTETIDDALRRLQSQRNVAARVQVLQDNDSELMRRIMNYTYNPYIRYGIKMTLANKHAVISVATVGGLGIEEDDVWNLLDDLSTTTGSSAAKLGRVVALAARLDPAAAVILTGILDKTVTTGVSASTVNKAYHKLIPVFSVQLAAKYTERKIKDFPMYAEIKEDGLRAIAIVHPTDDVEVVTRKGNPIPAATPFHKNLVKLGRSYRKVIAVPTGVDYNGCVFDGELCGETFADAISTFRSNEEATTGSYKIFDVLPMAALTDDNFQSEPFSTRREQLRLVFEDAAFDPSYTDIVRSKSYIVSSKTEIWNMYYTARAAGQEGLIIKLADGKWTTKRTSDWQKIKACETTDLPIVGAFEGTGDKTGTLGGLIVDRDGVQVRVGSGFTDALSDVLWEMFLRDLSRSQSGITDVEEFELIGSLVELQYQEVTPDGSLRHPVFVRLRKDKTEVSF